MCEDMGSLIRSGILHQSHGLHGKRNQEAFAFTSGQMVVAHCHGTHAKDVCSVSPQFRGMPTVGLRLNSGEKSWVT